MWARKRVKKHPKSHTTVWCNKWLNFFRSAFDFKCTFCGKQFDETGLDFIHVKPTPIAGHNARGKSSRVKDIREHQDCYTIGCKWCHKRYDNPIDKSAKADMQAKVVTLKDKLSCIIQPAMVVCDVTRR